MEIAAGSTLSESGWRPVAVLAQEKDCEAVALPLITASGYPEGQALRAAVDTIGAFLLERGRTVYLAAPDKSA